MESGRGRGTEKNSRWRLMHGALALALSLMTSLAARAAEPIKLSVDATDLPRRLLHARLEIPSQGGPMRLWYPKWVPGVHGPVGPVENLGGLRFETPSGEAIPWKRDSSDLFLFQVEPPAGVDRVVVHIDYICNQPSVNSMGVDSFGASVLGVINWNTCLLYPEGSPAWEIPMEVTLKLPPEWKWASALATPPPAENGSSAAGVEGPTNMVTFAPTSLYRLIDSPLICGRYMRTLDLSAENFPPVTMEIVAGAASALQLPEEAVNAYRAVVAESREMFGAGHFDHYKFLLVLSDQLPYNGLEHHASSLNGVNERDLFDEEKRKGWVGYLLPHEFMHSWCGKFRRPAGMAAEAYHQPQGLNLLWVYEGLAQYLGELVMVRAGMLSTEEYQDQLAGKIGGLMSQQGRRWRPLEDTAVSSWLLRGHSPNWDTLRRGQDYYDEGLLLWMQIDTVLREGSDGKKSIEDFCRAFMGEMASEKPFLAFEEADIISILNGLVPRDWAGMIDSWVSSAHETLPLEWIDGLGYRLQFSNEPTKLQRDRERERGWVSATDTLGLTFSMDGRVSRVIPGSPGDAAAFGPGTQVIGVNGRKFTAQRLRDAIADSVTRRKIDFLLLDGEEFREVSIPYEGGPRYLRLVRNSDAPDRLGEIIKPRRPDAPKGEPAKK